MNNASSPRELPESPSELSSYYQETIPLLLEQQLPQTLVNPVPTPPLLTPSTVNDLATIISYCHHNTSPVLITGNSSKLSWGGLASKPIDFIVSTQKLNRLIDHAVGDLTVTVEAGIKLADLQTVLSQTQQFLPLDPSYPDIATIGGIIATADAGSWRQRYGGVRDLLLGLSFVRGDGKIAKAGGRVVKNVAGYDLMKLFTGSYGSLGIITEATFRLYPLPPAAITVVLTGELEAIAKFQQLCLQSGLTPTAFDFSYYPSLGATPGLILRFQSIPESIIEQSQQVQSLAQQLNLAAEIYQENAELNLWEQLQKINLNFPSEQIITCKIGILPSKIPQLLKEYARITNKQGLAMITASTGIGKLFLVSEQPVNQLQEIRNIAEQYQGFLSILQAPSVIKKELEPWGYRGNNLKIMAELKSQFDPKNIYNPGRFVGNI